MLESLSYRTEAPALRGRIRSQPEDFEVQEELGFDADGEGEHVWLRVRKRAANTAWVAEQLAAYAGVAERAVSYAGLKDRWAVAEQWFSVHLPGRRDPDWSACGGADFSVLQHIRHGRKLRRGALKSNSFRIVVRDLDGPVTDLEERLQRALAEGVPNYFGEQRFGREGANLKQAELMFAGRRVRNRHHRSLYVSAARSHIFNQVLSRRVAENTWNRALAGDVMMLEGTHSIFTVDQPDAEIMQRIAVLDIHPTGPLWGAGEPLSRAIVLSLEKTVAENLSTLCSGLQRIDNLRQERRALRLRLNKAALECHKDHVQICLDLPAGAYATTVLRELLHYTESVH